MSPISRRIVRVAMVVAVAMWGIAATATAQVIGTFRWHTEPFCNVLTLTVTAAPGGIFTLDGFDEQCGGNPRQPVHGIAVAQANGSITLGLNVVMLPAGQPVNIEAGISQMDFNGTWRDSAGQSGALLFSPTQTSGGPRGGPIQPAPLPNTFFHTPNGNFVITAGPQVDVLPINGAGNRLVWQASKSAFRAGHADGTEWDDANIGSFSTAFGVRTTASGTASFAAGRDTRATGTSSVALGAFASSGPGSFTFGDGSSRDPIVSQTNQFNVRAVGGFGFYTNGSLTAGVEIHAGSSQFTFLSDVNAKEHFRDLDADDLLAKIARMPVQEWSYKTQGPSIRHVGPTAQDFRAAFGLGEHPLRIGALDADGINFAAVKALEARTRASDERRQTLEQELATLRAQVEELTRIVAALGAPRQ